MNMTIITLLMFCRCVYAQAATNLPPITTHNIVGDATDPVMSAIRRCQLFNNRYDRVKVPQHRSDHRVLRLMVAICDSTVTLSDCLIQVCRENYIFKSK